MADVARTWDAAAELDAALASLVGIAWLPVLPVLSIVALVALRRVLEVRRRLPLVTHPPATNRDLPPA